MAESWKREWNCGSCAPHSFLSCQGCSLRGFGEDSNEPCTCEGSREWVSPRGASSLSLDMVGGEMGSASSRCPVKAEWVPQSALSLGWVCSVRSGWRVDFWVPAVFTGAHPEAVWDVCWSSCRHLASRKGSEPSVCWQLRAGCQSPKCLQQSALGRRSIFCLIFTVSR